jgi:rhodanese-related sulfurtransferase
MSSQDFPVVQGKMLVEALLLCVLAGAVGLGLNFNTVYNAFTGRLVVSSEGVSESGPAEKVSGSVVATETLDPFPVSLEEIDDLLAEGALLIDARSAEDYRAGHLVGAMSLPLGQTERMLGDFTESVSVDKPLILYCSGYGCPDSHKVGILLIQKGFTDVLVYEGGYPEWRDAGRQVIGGAQ